MHFSTPNLHNVHSTVLIQIQNKFYYQQSFEKLYTKEKGYNYTALLNSGCQSHLLCANPLRIKTQDIRIAIFIITKVESTTKIQSQIHFF